MRFLSNFSVLGLVAMSMIFPSSIRVHFSDCSDLLFMLPLITDAGCVCPDVDCVKVDVGVRGCARLLQQVQADSVDL